MCELTGVALDAAVAAALRLPRLVYRPNGQPAYEVDFNPGGPADEYDSAHEKMWQYFTPSTDAAQAMKLLTNHSMTIYCGGSRAEPWTAGFQLQDYGPMHEAFGATPQIAICRAIVTRAAAEAQAVIDAAAHEAETERLVGVRNIAWARAEQARQTRVPFTAFEDDEARRSYALCLDQQLDLIRQRNGVVVPSKPEKRWIDPVKPANDTRDGDLS